MTKKEVEEAIGNHAEWIEHLAARMDQLAAAQIKTDEQVAETSRALKELGAETSRSFEKTDKRIRELGEKTDKRIADLVGAIGKLIEREGRR